MGIHPTEEGATVGPNYLTIGASGGPGLLDHCHVYRLLSWNPWQGVFLRLVERLHGRRLC